MLNFLLSSLPILLNALVSKFFSRFYCISLILFLLPKISFAFFINTNRDRLQITGSSTVYPFVSTIAETFGRETKFKTPVVESIGTGGGFKIFCQGIGSNFPDFTNASRSILATEAEICKQNSINFIEIKLGYDGIVIANTNKSLPLNLNKQDIFLALSPLVPSTDGQKLIPNPYKNWSEVNAKLANMPIVFYGPPPSSGTRDSFVELVLEHTCLDHPLFIANFADKKERKRACGKIRSDGVFIEVGENDNLIVQKLLGNKQALGIFGYSFLSENNHILQASKIDNVSPSFDSIMNRSYTVSRPLFIYAKTNKLKITTGMIDFIKEIISKNTIGKDGYLLQKGLVPLSDHELEQIRSEITKLLSD